MTSIPDPPALPRISRFDRDWLHKGGNPAQVYQGEALALYERIKAQEESDNGKAEPQRSLL